MKFGKMVQSQMLPEFKGEYINYKQLNDIIKKSSIAFHQDKLHLYEGGIRYYPGEDPVRYPYGSQIPPRLPKEEDDSDDDTGDDLQWSFNLPWQHNQENQKPQKDGSDNGSNYGSVDTTDFTLTVSEEGNSESSKVKKNKEKGKDKSKSKEKKKLKKREAELIMQHSMSSPKSRNGSDYYVSSDTGSNTPLAQIAQDPGSVDKPPNNNNGIPSLNDLPPLPATNLQLNVDAPPLDNNHKSPASVPPVPHGADGESPMNTNLLQKFKRTLSLQNQAAILSPMEGDKSPGGNPHTYEQLQTAFWTTLTTGMDNVHKHYSSCLARLQVDLQKYLQHGGQVARLHRFAAESFDKVTDSPMLHNTINPAVTGDVTELAPPDQTWYAEVLGAYRRVCRLRRYAQLNYLIVERLQSKYIKFQPKVGVDHAPAPVNKQRVSALRKKVSKLDWVKMTDLEKLRERISSSGMLSVTDMGCMEAETADSSKSVASGFLGIVKLRFLLQAVGVMALVLMLPLDLLRHKEGIENPEWISRNWQAQKGQAQQLFAVIMWCTEALPYFATGLTLPPLISIMGILQDHMTGQVLAPKEAAQIQAQKMFNSTTCLLLLGYSLATVACSAQLEKRISAFLYSHLGNKPQFFLLAIMALSWVLSTWLNNHTGPVLTVSVVSPLLADLGSESPFVKAQLLGIAVGSNLGGMASPLASLQNILAVQAQQTVAPVSFLAWLQLCGGVSLLLLVVAWLLLCRDVDWSSIALPVQQPRKHKFTASQRVAVASCLVAVVLLATASHTEAVFGGLIPIALAYMSFVFGSGILKTSQLHSFPWPLILLVSSASTLSAAIESCKLLDILANTATSTLSANPSILCIQLQFIVTVLSSCVSHTVAALVLTPLMAQIALPLHLSTRIIIGTAQCINAAMPLPFSSFPNLHSLALKDDTGTAYLRAKDIMKIGFILTMVSFLVIITIALPGIKYLIE